MIFRRNIAKRGESEDVQPYATTPRGYPYPLRSWVPDVAIDIQNLATAVDTDLTKMGYAEVSFTYAAVPGGEAILAAQSITDSSGAAIGSIVSQKFRLTNAGTYHIAIGTMVDVSGDSWPAGFSTIRKYTAGKDLYVKYWDYGGTPKDYTFYLSPDDWDAVGNTLPAGFAPLSLAATMMVHRIL